jgi:hypothetical protein
MSEIFDEELTFKESKGIYSFKKHISKEVRISHFLMKKKEKRDRGQIV